jgi:hypothetical protein
VSDIKSAPLHSVIESTGRIRDGKGTFWDYNKFFFYWDVWRPIAQLIGL